MISPRSDEEAGKGRRGKKGRKGKPPLSPGETSPAAANAKGSRSKATAAAALVRMTSSCLLTSLFFPTAKLRTSSDRARPALSNMPHIHPRGRLSIGSSNTGKSAWVPMKGMVTSCRSTWARLLDIAHREKHAERVGDWPMKWTLQKIMCLSQDHPHSRALTDVLLFNF